MSSSEQGEIYFFYRQKIDVEQVSSLDDIQRTYMVLVPDGAKLGRLLIIGRKQMPDIPEGSSKSTQRDWLVVEMVDAPSRIGKALGPVVYDTETRGEREQPQAVPVGQGRYAIVERKGTTRLALRLSRPRSPGRPQEILGLHKEATYVLSVRNPSVEVPGFPDERPQYPEALNERFADKRWLDIEDPRLLDYPHAQLLLIGAHEGIDHLDERLSGRADVFGRLDQDESDWQTQALSGKEFPPPAAKAGARAPAGDRGKGGRRGGQQATQTASAAGISKALVGIDFPRKRSGLIRHAKSQKAADEIIEVLNELPDRQFQDMADVQRAVGEVR